MRVTSAARGYVVLTVNSSGWQPGGGVVEVEAAGAVEAEFRPRGCAAIRELAPGVAFVGLAIVGALKRDSLQIVAPAAAAIDNAHQTGSGVVIREMESLRPYLGKHLSDLHVRHFDSEIARLSAARA
jgi:hypothetical protein